MRRVLCLKCAEGKTEGTRMLYPSNGLEPAEYERVVFGVAKPPLPKNRIAYLNGNPIQLEHNQYECDSCSAVIHIGDRCCAWSVWTDTTPLMMPWEHEFLV